MMTFLKTLAGKKKPDHPEKKIKTRNKWHNSKTPKREIINFGGKLLKIKNRNKLNNSKTPKKEMIKFGEYRIKKK
jgi:hypothetical protein